MEAGHEPSTPSIAISTSKERAIQSARLFRSLATPSCLITPAKKRQASELIAEAKSNGLMDSFEEMDEWFRTEPVQRVRSNDATKNPSKKANNNEDDSRNSPLGGIQLKQVFERARRMILNRAHVDDKLPPFVYSEGNSRVNREGSLVEKIEAIPLSETAVWQELLKKLIEQAESNGHHLDC